MSTEAFVVVVVAVVVVVVRTVLFLVLPCCILRSSDFALPQIRSRLYFICIRLRANPNAGDDDFDDDETIDDESVTACISAVSQRRGTIICIVLSKNCT